MGPRAGLEGCGKSLFHWYSIPVPSNPYPTVIPATLYRHRRMWRKKHIRMFTDNTRKVVETSWNVMAHVHKPDFIFRAKRTSPFKSAGASVQSTTCSRGVRISGSNAGYTMFLGSVKGTGSHSIRQFSLHFPSRASPCVITFQLESVYGLSYITRRKNSWERKTCLQNKKIIFHQDNAPAHKNVLAMGKLRDLHYDLLEHPPIPQIWFPLTSVSSQNSNSSSLVSVFLRIKRRLQL
jgi:hypothetical protein